MLLSLPLWAATANDSLQPITLQLRWLHQFQFAGYYAAKQQGYYRDAGLDVEIRPGAPGREPVKEVVEERAHYGVGNSELLHQRLNGTSNKAITLFLRTLPNQLIQPGRELADRVLHA